MLRSIDRDLFHRGSWRLLDIRSAGDDSYADLVAYEWQLGSDRAVIAANIAGREAQGLLQLSPLADGAAFDFVDQLTDNRYRWTREDVTGGLYVRLGAGAAHLFLVDHA